MRESSERIMSNIKKIYCIVYIYIYKRSNIDKELSHERMFLRDSSERIMSNICV